MMRPPFTVRKPLKGSNEWRVVVAGVLWVTHATRQAAKARVDELNQAYAMGYKEGVSPR